MVAKRNLGLEAQASTYRPTINLLCIKLTYILMFAIYPVSQLLFPKRKNQNVCNIGKLGQDRHETSILFHDTTNKPVYPSSNFFTDRSKAVLLLWTIYVFLSCFLLYLRARVCLMIPRGHLLGKG